ncbi:MAG: rhomboid family intramembrane serine protease [Candidatus Thermoplasmatota archaeon]|nr:rhomboid family intramembrane serine protease [Candidatus Thermoplasmatota archaeon]
MNALLLAIILVIIGSFIYSAIKRLSLPLTIVIANFIVFLILISANFLQYYELLNDAILTLGCKPSYISSAKFYTVLTHLYLHGSIFHILINMLFLIFIGLPFEERVGSPQFAFVYFVSGIFAVLFNALIFYLSQGSIAQDNLGIGASGAIFGIMCSYAFLYPKDEVAAPLGFVWLPRVPIIIVAALYFGIETLYTVMRVSDSIGHIAHLGGAIAGICIAPVLKFKLAAQLKGIKFAELEKVAEMQEELRDLLAKIKAEDLEEVRRVWLEEFFKSAKCLRCKGDFMIRKRFAKCMSCGVKIKFYSSLGKLR